MEVLEALEASNEVRIAQFGLQTADFPIKIQGFGWERWVRWADGSCQALSRQLPVDFLLSGPLEIRCASDARRHMGREEGSSAPFATVFRWFLARNRAKVEENVVNYRCRRSWQVLRMPTQMARSCSG